MYSPQQVLGLPRDVRRDWCAQNISKGRRSRGILIRCSKHISRLHSTPTSFYSKLPLDDWAPHPISEAEPSHSLGKPQFSRLYPWPCSFGHYPEPMTIGEGRNLDGPVNRELHLTTDATPNHSILRSLMNKTPIYLNALAWGSNPNNLCDNLSDAVFHFYADDTVIYCSSPSDVQTCFFYCLSLMLSSLTLPNLSWLFNGERSKVSYLVIFPSYHLLCVSVYEMVNS